MTPKENLRRVVRFERPEYIPMRFHINASCWHHYDQQALQELMAEHEFLFPGYEIKDRVEPHYGPCDRADEPFTDDFGCVWETSDNGITGAVTQHPLADWDAFDDYQMPDPGTSNGLTPINWDDVRAGVKAANAAGRMPQGGLRHGHTFLQLTYIRGYENLLFDMVDDDPRLHKLIADLEALNLGLVTRFLDAGVEYMGYAEDLGMQVGPMLSPPQFRKFIKPSYERLMAPAREAGCIVHMHSDGDIRQLVEDLFDGGVDIINLQDLVNGIDWIKENLAGKHAIDLDIDRQEITRFGTPQAIDDLIRKEVETLGSKEGGLSMIFGLYPGTPLENVKALMDAMEKYAFHYS